VRPVRRRQAALERPLPLLEGVFRRHAARRHADVADHALERGRALAAAAAATRRRGD